MLVVVTIVNLLLVLGSISLAAYIFSKLSEIKMLKEVVEATRELAKKDLDTERQIVVDMKEILSLMQQETQSYQKLIDVSQEWLNSFEEKAYKPNVQSPEKKKRGRPRKNNTPTNP